MHSNPARVLEQADVRRLLTHAQLLRHPQRNTVIILLSFKCGMRAGEIAGLTWPMVLNTSDRINSQVCIPPCIAKNGGGRIIPMHSELRRALMALHRASQRPREGPVVISERGGAMTARSIVNWFTDAYSALKLTGCSSHSGRRTFITRAARAISKTGGSLRDIQELAGHRSVTTTERYIAGDRVAQLRIVAAI